MLTTITRQEWLANAIEAIKQILKDNPENGYWKIKLAKYRKEYYELTAER